MPRKLKNTTTAPAPEAQRIARPAAGTRAVEIHAPSSGSVQRTRYESSPRFLLTWAPKRYQLDVEGRVFPQLGKLYLQPGLNGVDSKGGWAMAKVLQEERGRIVLMPETATAEDTPDGLPGYLRATKTAAGEHYHTAWERLEVHAGDGVIVPIDPDGYRAWLSALEDRGVLPPIHRRVIERLRHQAQTALENASSRKSVGAARTVQMAEKQIAALDALDG